jgi:methanogenic corrinoid protein MtbC1
MQEVIRLLEQNNLNKDIKTIIGGAPASREYAEKIGADAFGFDASNSVLVAKKMLGKK